jgi:hypothetical protein
MSYSRPAPSSATLRRERTQDRRILNCVDNPRTVFNVTIINSPSSLEEDFLMKWIEEKPPLTAYEATLLLDKKSPFFLVDMLHKRPTGVFNYRAVQSQDVIIVWDWSRAWVKKSGNKIKTPVPVLKKVMMMEGRQLHRRLKGNVEDLILPFDSGNTRALVS